MRYCIRISLLLLLFSFSAGGLAAPATKALAGIPNFHTVAPGIYRGGAPTREGLKALSKMGVRTIIDLRIEKQAKRVEKPLAEKMGFTWIHIPMGREAPTEKQVATFLATLAKAPERPVFVHCQHGADRTGCMIGIYRVQVQKWPFERAWAEMLRYGFKPWLHELKAAVRSRARS
ncbi:MAG TPA: dual specificity protein phosphatase family protein [Armatimonadetes bacterium]|jgi:tyrosine-protein phosphatase SIW14|nr:dual specificity protein phosphatase family protein [Armatimonadota bacterium]HHX39689.1 dual specificity protein phosphatase family protein [Armatimonadota bacterium]HOJ21001.1 tyrosine-protein phosphatase [Armatimonadota bacterium]HOM82953.1 tyrosine-protein phosphatase [Armatimonadota bacterium]HOQ30280.1 tyrosine-protein phosphatase [Armatimonadota bacterium]